MTYELPGPYKIDGVRAIVKAPDGSKFSNVIPLEHIAYNIVLPRIGKPIDKENYKEKIRDNVRSVEFWQAGNSVYDIKRKEIKISSSWAKKSRPKTAFILSDRLGQAFSNDHVASYIGTPGYMEISRYYSTLSAKIGERELKGTKYSFETRDQLKEVDKLCKAFYVFEKMIHETISEGLRKLLNDIDNGTELKSAQWRLGELREGVDYLKRGVENANENFGYGIRGQALAEIVAKKLKTGECFAAPRDMFLNDKKSIVLKPEIAKKLPDEDIKLLLELYEKTNFLYHHKFYMNKKHGNRTGKDVIFNMTYSLLNDFRDDISKLMENESSGQIYLENLKKYDSFAS